MKSAKFTLVWVLKKSINIRKEISLSSENLHFSREICRPQRISHCLQSWGGRAAAGSVRVATSVQLFVWFQTEEKYISNKVKVTILYIQLTLFSFLILVSLSQSPQLKHQRWLRKPLLSTILDNLNLLPHNQK